ncbi:MAG: hypothetical protein V4495_19785 [Pseudomonadota bacterium]
MSKNLVGIVVAACVLASMTYGGYVWGRHQGKIEGRVSATDDYNFWAISLMHEDPQLELKSLTIVKDGDQITKPFCELPSQPRLRLARRPDSDSNLANIVNAPNSHAWIAKIPNIEGVVDPRAAALVGCFRDLPGSPTKM